MVDSGRFTTMARASRARRAFAAAGPRISRPFVRASHSSSARTLPSIANISRAPAAARSATARPSRDWSSFASVLHGAEVQTGILKRKAGFERVVAHPRQRQPLVSGRRDRPGARSSTLPHPPPGPCRADGRDRARRERCPGHPGVRCSPAQSPAGRHPAASGQGRSQTPGSPSTRSSAANTAHRLRLLRLGSDPKKNRAIGEWLDMYGNRWKRNRGRVDADRGALTDRWSRMGV